MLVLNVFFFSPAAVSPCLVLGCIEYSCGPVALHCPPPLCPEVWTFRSFFSRFCLCSLFFPIQSFDEERSGERVTPFPSAFLCCVPRVDFWLKVFFPLFVGRTLIYPCTSSVNSKEVDWPPISPLQCSPIVFFLPILFSRFQGWSLVGTGRQWYLSVSVLAVIYVGLLTLVFFLALRGHPVPISSGKVTGEHCPFPMTLILFA